MSRAIAELAARAVGRRVRIRGGHIATVTRVTGRGLTVTVAGIRGEDIETYLD
jgi:preprotein translocase subunit YajC